MGGMSWIQAQSQKALFEKMQKQGTKVIVVDLKSDHFTHTFTFGRAGAAWKCSNGKVHRYF